MLGSAPAVAAADGAVLPLRVVTYNVLHGGLVSGFAEGDTHLEARLAMAVEELKALDPDIIALQEASESRRHGNVPRRLAEHLGFHVVFAPATERIVRFRPLDRLIVALLGFKEGIAILSRFPVVQKAIHDLPRCRHKLEPRILLHVEVQTPAGPLPVFSTHTARGDECQIERVGEIVQAGRGPGLSLLMGDFNVAETSPALTTLRQEPGVIDAFRAVNPDDPGPTVWQRIEVERPTVSRRVDFIFLLNGGASSGAVRSSRTVFNRPGRLANGAALWPSDHYGVFAEVEPSSIESRRTAERSRRGVGQ
ncbi:endonuclease/exonuclease/phosphatase family protein [Candidatus Nitrospira bockiana]